MCKVFIGFTLNLNRRSVKRRSAWKRQVKSILKL